MTAQASLSSKGTFEVCSRWKDVAASSPTISGRCERVWQTLTAIGPSEAIRSHKTAPRPSPGPSPLTSLVGSKSSDFSPSASPSVARSHSLRALYNVEATKAKRLRISAGRAAKNCFSSSLSSCPALNPSKSRHWSSSAHRTVEAAEPREATCGESSVIVLTIRGCLFRGDTE